MRMRIGSSRKGVAHAVALVAGVLAGLFVARTDVHAQQTAPSAPARSAPMTHRPSLIPWPTTVDVSTTESMAITKDTVIEISPSRPDLRRIAVYLADLVQPALEASLGDSRRHRTAGSKRHPARSCCRSVHR